ncbi:MAG: LuxR C-terminal-related transcriptional regulator [Omnitrophica WOR_2 bacterium]
MPNPENNELSEREREILRLTATGASNKEIAQSLGISANTVKVHLRNIFVKIGVISRTEAAMYAVRIGLVQASESVNKGENGGVEPVIPPTTISAETPASSTPPPPPLPTAKKTILKRYPIPLSLATMAVLLLGLFGGGLLLSRQSPGQATSTGITVSTPSPHWQALAALPIARSSLALAAYGKYIYAIAGKTAQGETGINETYDTETNEWTTGALKPNAVSQVSAAVIGGLVYVPGGRLNSGMLMNTLDVYNPRSNQWEKRASLPKAISGYALAAFEGRLYLFGGWDGKGYLNSAYAYDPSRDAWIELTPMPTARGFAGAAEAGGKIYIIGGTNGQESLSTNEEYSPDQDGGGGNPWKTVAAMPEGRTNMGVASIADMVYVIGGITSGRTATNSLIYLPQVNNWKAIEAPSLNVGSDLGLVSVGMDLYAIGGQVDTLPTSKNMVYQAIYTISIPVIVK